LSSEETATSETPEPSPLDEQQQREQHPEGSEGYWRGKATQYQQQLKKAQDLNREATPYVQTAMALQAAPGGNEIIDKLQKGESLTPTQEKKLEKAQEDAGTSGMSKEQIEEMLATSAQNFEQRLWEQRKAEKAMDELHEWAGKKYPGYQELHTTDEWNTKLGTILDAIQAGKLRVPEGDDAYKHAIDQTYGWLKGLNPNIGKEKPSKKTEKARREAISQSSVEAGGVAPEDSDDVPDYARADLPPKSLGGGRAFGSLKRS
jgi:hypothetical protein